MALTAKQQRFVDEYLIDRNATRAAIRAGYAESGARTEGARLLAHPDVAEALADAAGEQGQRTKVEADRVLREIAALALWDPADFVEVMMEEPPGSGTWIVEGVTKPEHVKQLPESVRRAIAGWGWDRNGNFTLKLYDKAKALDMLMRHLGQYNDKLEVNNPTNGLAERMQKIHAAMEEKRKREREAAEQEIERRVAAGIAAKSGQPESV